MQKLDWEAYRDYAKENGLHMKLLGNIPFVQVAVVDGDYAVATGTGTSLQAAIYDSAVAFGQTNGVSFTGGIK
jgi:hypothetical protein